MHFKVLKNRRSEHFWKITLAKRAPECSETSICTQNARNMMCSEHFWKMKPPDCSESSKNWHVRSSAGFWWLSPKTVEAKRSSTAARRKGSAMLHARLQREVARRSFAKGSFRPKCYALAIFGIAAGGC